MKTAILFELHHLGDAVLSVPFVRAMAKKEGGNLHVVCRNGSLPIFRKFLPISQIHLWEPWWELRGATKWSSFFSLSSLLKVLRALQPEQAFCVWADSRVHWMMRQTAAGQTFGFPVNEQNFYAHERPWRRRRMKLGRLLGHLAPLNHPLQRLDYQQSHLADWQQLTEAALLPWDTNTPWFDVSPHSQADTLRQPDKRLWLIHPGGRLSTKRWPIERFQMLVDTTFRDLTTMLIQPPDSAALVSSRPNHSSIAPLDFDDLLALVESADAVLCNDSLVSHLAAALGKPVWTIFGSGNPNWFAPLGNANRVIASEICSFRPCIDRCVYKSPICLEAVTVRNVTDHLLKC